MLVRQVTIIVVATLVGLSHSQFTPLTPSESYTRTYTVEANNYVFWWKIINTNEIQIEVHCRSLGWVGFGISPVGGMTGADITKFWIKDGLIFLFDSYAVANASPRTDTVQNVQWIGGAELNGFTMVKFKRRLDTGDTNHDLPILNQDQYLIFAWNQNDPVTGDGDWLYHQRNRFWVQLNLLG